MADRDTLGGATNYSAIHYYIRYSVACTSDMQGRQLKQACMDHNAPEAFAAYFAALVERERPAECFGLRFAGAG